MMRNRYEGRCSSCNCRVKVSEGFVRNEGGRWITYCREHSPEQIVERNELTESGKLYFSFSDDALQLVRSLPGARFNGENQSDKHWTVSLANADRPRLLDVCEQLKLKVAPALQVYQQSEQATQADLDGLYPFQVTGVDFLSQHSGALLADDMGLGKAQPLTSTLWTTSGPIKMGDIQVGQKIIGRNGRETTVTGVFPQGVKSVYEVRFTDGVSVRCCDEHLWAVNTPTRKYRDQPHQVKSLHDIRTSLAYNNGNLRHYVPQTLPVQFSGRLPVNGYLLGYLLANGNLTSHTPRLSIPDTETVDRLQRMLPAGMSLKYTSGIDFYLSQDDRLPVLDSNTVTAVLRQVGLMGGKAEAKFLPESWLYVSIDDRLDLLQGLLDGDGSVCDNHVEFSSASKSLAEAVILLVQSLGGTATLNVKDEVFYTYNGEILQGLPSYRVCVRLPNGISPFRLSRKAACFCGWLKYPPIRGIKEVVFVGEEECQCISVDAADHLYLTDGFVVTHNTVQALRALSTSDGALVVCPSAVKYNWKKEIQQWVPNFTATVLDTKTIKDNGLTPPKAGEIFIVNFEALPKSLLEYKDWRVVEQYRQTANVWSATTLIVDEAHRAKNTKSQVHAKVAFLAQVCRRTWLLTGTPLMNRATDLWGVLRAGNLAGTVFGRGKYGYERFQELFQARQTRWGVEYGLALPEVAERLRRVMLRRTKAEVLPDLPSKSYQTLSVNGMSVALKAALDKAWAEFADQIEAGELPPFEQFSGLRARLAEERIPAVLDLVADYEEQDVPLLVFSAHKAPVEAVAQREGWACITGDTAPEDRTEIVRAFQAGALRGVALTIQAGGVGLTLTRAATVLFVDLDWTPALNAQAEDRVCRIGQKASAIRIIRMVSTHELDVHVLNLLAKKIDLITSAIESRIQVQGQEHEVETVEQYQERMEALRAAGEEAERQAAAEAEKQLRERAVARLDDILARQIARAKRPETPLSDEVKAVIPDALNYLLNRCDGAEERDYMGFSKPDVYTSRLLAATGFGDDRSYRAGERLLSRYYGQLHTVYPSLFAK